MKKNSQVIFWIGVYVLFILIYQNAMTSFSMSMYFVSMLFPVVLGTALFFNYHLVPNFLMQDRKKKFMLYAAYALIISFYVIIVVIYIAFIVLAELRLDQLGPKILDVTNMVVVMYGVVFAHGFLLTFRKYQKSQTDLAQLTAVHEKSKIATITIKTDRQNKPIELAEILYLESLADYVKVHLVSASPVITKQKISSFENDLPENFIRIHRSFIVNLHHIKSYNKEKIATNGGELPISRKYKNQVLELLQQQS